MGQMSFSKVWAEVLGPFYLFPCEIRPFRTAGLNKQSCPPIGKSQLSVCQGIIGIGFNRLLEKVDRCLHLWLALFTIATLIKAEDTLQIKLVSDWFGRIFAQPALL